MTKMIIVKNQTENDIKIIDIGEIIIPASGQFDFTGNYPIETIYNSSDLKTKITNENIIINDGVKDLNKEESLEFLELRSLLEEYNPYDYIYVTQANILNNIFLNHTEFVHLEDSLKNVFVDTFQGVTKISSSSQIEVDGAGLLIASDSQEIQKENFDDISDWDNDAQTTFTLETTIKQEGTGSGKMISTTNAKSWRGCNKDISDENWETYDTISLDVYGVGIGEKIKIILTNNVTAYETQEFLLSSGWQTVYFDISQISRNLIKNINIQLQKNTSQDVIVYLDDLRIRNSESYYSSGYAISTVETLSMDIKWIYYCDLVDIVENTSYTIKISLDAGNHWHLLEEDEFRKWVDITQWSEYSSFDNLKNLQVRIDLATMDISVTPLVDDYFVMWKFDI